VSAILPPLRRLLPPILLLLLAAPAARADTPATCANLQSKLNVATVGDTITLSGTCTGQSFTILSAHAPITLKANAPGDGFNGGAVNTPILTGVDVGATTISGLTFTNGNVTTGSHPGAIEITGNSAPQIIGSKFFANTGTTAGAVSIQASPASGTTTIQGNTFGSATPGQGNTGRVGGGLSLAVSAGSAVVSGNDVTGNSSTLGHGGGVYVASLTTGSLTVTGNRIDANSLTAATGDQDGGGMFLFDEGATIAISQNQFIENTIGATTGNRHGAGLAIVAGGSAQTHVAQTANGFDENSIASAASGEAGGAGEWIVGARVDSTRDSFTSNTISHTGGEGAGVGVEGLMYSPTVLLAGELHATDLVADGNRLAVGGRGAGVYAGGPDTCTIADCPSVLELSDSTVAGNCVDPGAGSQAPGIASSGDDTLTLRNSIVYDHQAALPCLSPAPMADIAGFGALALSSTDACDGLTAAAAPFGGPGNICADPLLGNPHFGGSLETAASPTIDRGSNAAVPAGLGLDAKGAPRITDGNGDGTPVVDMGADESPAKPVPPVPDTTPPKIVIVSKTVKESATARVHIRLQCIEQSHCGGSLALTTNSHGKKVKAGTGRFNIPGGSKRTVVIKLPRKVRALLTRHTRIRISAKATARDLAGNVGRASKRVTVKARKKKR
jgi:hypothetical protein